MEKLNIIDMLKFGNTELKREAIKKISTMSSYSEILGKLFFLLKESNETVRFWALQAIKVIKGEATSRKLEELLSDPCEEIRREATIELGNRKWTAPAKILPLLADTSEAVREAAIYSLKNMDITPSFAENVYTASNPWLIKNNFIEVLITKHELAEEVVNRLLQKNEEEKFWAVRIAAHTLVDIPSKKLEELFFSFPKLRIAILEYMEKNATPTVKIIEAALQDSEQIREAAVKAAKLLIPEEAAKLISLFDHKSWIVRKATYEILSETLEANIGVLEEEIENPSSEDRFFWCLQLFAKLSDEATGKIRHILENKPEFIKACLVALGNISTPDSADTMIKLISTVSEDEFKVLSKSIIKQKQLTIPRLIPLLSNPVWKVRKRAAFLLKQVKEPQTYVPLLNILTSKEASKDAIYWSKEILKEMPVPASLLAENLEKAPTPAKLALLEVIAFKNVDVSNQILPLLFEKTPELVSEAIKTLAILHYSPLLTHLSKIPEDHWLIRKAIVFALGRLASKNQAKSILKYLSDESLSVIVEAIEAAANQYLTSATPKMIKLFSHPDIRIKEAVINFFLKTHSSSTQFFEVLRSTFWNLPTKLKLKALDALKLDSSTPFSFVKSIIESKVNTQLKLKAIELLTPTRSNIQFLTDLSCHQNRLIANKASKLLAEYTEDEKPTSSWQQRVISLYRLGLVFLKGKRIHEALTAFKRVIKMDPGMYEAYIQLAKIYKDQNNLPEAMRMLAMAIEIAPEKPEAYFLAAIIKKLAGDTKAALTYLKDAQKYDKDAKFKRIIDSLLVKWK